MTKILTVHKAALECEEINLGHRKTWPTGLLPLMTWADWELLQELHKARNGEGTATIQFAPVNVTTENGDPALFPSYDKQYESLAPRASGGGPAMNWQAVAADLQDQIKDWETKCRQLENERNEALSAAIVNAQALQRAADEIAQLSKSLQHYRNAYFADQGKEGNSDGQK